MTLPEPLQNFWDDQTSIIEALYQRREVSLAQSAQNIFAKSLVLTAASFFETEIRDLVIRALTRRAQGDDCVLSFCHRRGIDRQFHTWFDWKQSSAAGFFAMFGDALKAESSARIRADARFDLAVKDYMFIGRKRNEMIHQNFLTYPFEETAEQTRTRIQNAAVFIEMAEALLMPAVAQDS